jgi:hypothetical protein
MEVTYFFETSADIHQAIWRCILEGSTLHSHRCQNLKSKKPLGHVILRVACSRDYTVDCWNSQIDPEHKVNRIQTKHSASMNTASKNNRNNVIGASSSLVQRRTNELNVGFACYFESCSFEAPHFAPRHHFKSQVYLFSLIKTETERPPHTAHAPVPNPEKQTEAVCLTASWPEPDFYRHVIKG